MIKCTLNDLYEFNKLNNYVDSEKIKVNTPSGFKSVKAVAVTAYNSKQIKITIENGLTLTGSPNHRIMSNNWIKLSNVTYNTKILTDTGFYNISNIEYLDNTADLLDIEVDGHEYYSNGIVSHNSSIKEALTISAYGRSALRKMKDIPNWINKNAYTYNEFQTSKGDTVVIERGIDPNFSSITVNGAPYNLPDKRKIDDYIETELLGLNFPIFCNTISLSFDDFKSFVNLSAADKRKIVDPMFGIDLLTDMKANIKTPLKENRKNLDILEANVVKSNSLLETSVNQLNELREKLSVAVEDRTSEITEEINTKKVKTFFNTSGGTK